jgi:hypothetical protein
MDILLIADDDIDADGKLKNGERLDGFNGLVEIAPNLFRASVEKIKIAGSLVAHLGTCLTVSGSVEVGGLVYIGESFKVGGDVKAPAGITVRGGIEAGGSIETGCAIQAGFGIRAGADIKAGWGILAGESIQCGGTLSARHRIFAGVSPRGTPCQWTIQCGRLESGEVCYGELVEMEQKEAKKEPAA